MSSKRTIGNPEYMKKRIPQNPKYQHVKSRLDTGQSLTKYMEKLEEIRKNYRYKKGELFKRLKVTTFAQLVLQVALVSDLSESIVDEATQPEDVITDSADGDHLPDQTDGSAHPSPQPLIPANSSEPGDAVFSPRSTLQSVISGVGELDLDVDETRTMKLNQLSTVDAAVDCPYPDCPYLLLDVRDSDQYGQCHIIGAHNYPIGMLCRTMNPYTNEVLTYRNAQGKIIILYDEDERIASQAATIMCERGFENLFMLSGGLKVIAQKFPEGMTTGDFPLACLPLPKGPAGRKTHHGAPRPAENKLRFTAEELNKIQHYMDEVLIPSETSSRLSSRMSTSSANSKVSSAWSSRLGSGSVRSQSSRPWK